MYEQTLYQIIEPVKKTTINRLNKGKKPTEKSVSGCSGFATASEEKNRSF